MKTTRSVARGMLLLAALTTPAFANKTQSDALTVSLAPSLAFAHTERGKIAYREESVGLLKDVDANSESARKLEKAYADYQLRPWLSMWFYDFLQFRVLGAHTAAAALWQEQLAQLEVRDPALAAAFRTDAEGALANAEAEIQADLLQLDALVQQDVNTLEHEAARMAQIRKIFEHLGKVMGGWNRFVEKNYEAMLARFAALEANQAYLDLVNTAKGSWFRSFLTETKEQKDAKSHLADYNHVKNAVLVPFEGEEGELAQVEKQTAQVRAIAKLTASKSGQLTLLRDNSNYSGAALAARESVLALFSLRTHEVARLDVMTIPELHGLAESLSSLEDTMDKVMLYNAVRMMRLAGQGLMVDVELEQPDLLLESATAVPVQ